MTEDEVKRVEPFLSNEMFDPEVMKVCFYVYIYYVYTCIYTYVYIHT
jgi:hypothetical protein